MPKKYTKEMLFLLFSQYIMSDSLPPHGLQHAKLLCPPLSARVCSNSYPLIQWCYLTIWYSATSFSFAFNLSQHHGLFQGEGCSHQAAKGLEFQLSHPSLQWIFRVDFFLDWLVWFPCSPRDSQESSPVPQLKALSHLILVRIVRIHGTWATTQPTHPAQHNGSSVSGGCTQEDGCLSPPSCQSMPTVSSWHGQAIRSVLLKLNSK